MSLSRVSLKKIVLWLLDHLSIHTDEVSLFFVSNKKMCLLHDQFFNDSSSTDCITLPLDPYNQPSSYHILGEAIICPKTALVYSKQHNLDPQEELYRYIIHCFLHFAGYRDDVPEEKKKMKRKENTVARKLNLALELGL